MEKIALPESFTDLTDEELQALYQKIVDASAGLAESAMTDDDALNEIERLANATLQIADESAARGIAAEERGQRAQQALDQINAAEPTDAEGDAENMSDVAPEGDDYMAASVETDVAEFNESTIPEMSIPVDVPSIQEAATLSVSPEAEVLTQEAAVADENTPEAIPASPGTSGSLVASLNGERPAGAEAPNVEPVGRQQVPFRSTGAMSLIERGSEVTSFSLANLIAEKHHQMSKLGGAAHEPIVLATAVTNWDKSQMLVSGHEENFSILAGLTKKATSLVASGGNCAPLAPVYDIFRLAEPMSPVEDALPVVGAPRGGIRYIQPPDFRDAAGGVRITTEAQDAAGYPPTAVKPCVAVSCPNILEEQVDAVSQCVTFGNLNYRVFPEQVEAFLLDLAVMFAETKEVAYLDAIDAGSTSVNTTPPYGAMRGTYFALNQSAQAYRKRNHMATDAPLDVMAPDTLLPFLKTDMVNDLHLGLSFLGATDAQVKAELFDGLNLNVTFYYDSATGANQAFSGAQNAGTLNTWPTVYRLYMFSPGTWIRLDAGTLDVGIVRDSTLNSTNDLQIFSEQWVKAVMIGIESLRINLTLCNDGTGPAPITALVCAS